MTITYADDKEFYDGIFALLERGIGFKADHYKLTITLTGGL